MAIGGDFRRSLTFEVFERMRDVMQTPLDS